MSEKCEWVCNDYKNVEHAMLTHAAGGRSATEYIEWRHHLIVGDPQPTPDGKEFTKEELKKMGLVGLYRKL